MDIDRTTVPGVGALYHFTTAAGARFALLVAASGNRHLLVYGAPGSDEPLAEVVLAAHEADQVAETLHSRSVGDRLTLLERRLDLLTGKRADR
ncbi:hypothetical protein ACWEKT_37545 [Nocardia takedensis]